MKKMIGILISVFLFVVGISIMFYPTVSNWVHEKTASSVIEDYMEETRHKTTNQFYEEFAEARLYNATLSGDVNSFVEAKNCAESGLKNANYWNTFDETSGIIGVIEIPKIKTILPIYHGTAESVLQKGAGHLEGSALPTGDIGNHTVITGHTGLPSAQLFTDLNELVMGDCFHLNVLDQVFNYQVTDTFVVLPSETEHLKSQPDKDLVTLVTCTPYGVNSHRLLVQATRIEDTIALPDQGQIASTDTQNDQIESDALQNLPVLISAAVVLYIVFGAVALYLVVQGRHNRKRIPNIIDSLAKDNIQLESDK